VPEVTGAPFEVTVITAEAAENCGTLAEGLKLSVVTVDGGGAANIAVLARSITAARPLEIETVFFIKKSPIVVICRVNASFECSR